MNQEERRRFLIEELLRERPSCRRQEIPPDADRQKVLLRSLMNVRHPGAISQRFLEVQDDYLQEELAEKISVSRQAVAKWESGQGYPEITNLIQISNLFHVTVDYLVRDQEGMMNCVDDSNENIEE